MTSLCYSKGHHQCLENKLDDMQEHTHLKSQAKLIQVRTIYAAEAKPWAPRQNEIHC